MRSPLCSDCGEICPEDQGIGSESESNHKILAIEKSYEKCHTYKTAIFGICLDNLMGTTPQVAPRIPFILSRLCRYIEHHGLHYKHLFLEDEKDLVESLKLEFNESGDAPLESAGNVASVSKLLIVFFEELPEPLIPVTSQPDFIKGMEKLSLSSMDCVAHLKQSVSKLPDSTYQVLKYLSRFLYNVASHKEHNGMSSDNLSVIFGPVIFRLTSNDPVTLTNVKSVVNNLVQNYHSVFEDDHKCISCDDENQKPNPVTSDTCLRRQIPCPSTVVPVMALMPLSVVIPSVDSNISKDKKSKENVPVLLIEGQCDGSQKAIEIKQSVMGVVKESIVVNRKRKERRLSSEDFQQRSSSEERPGPVSLTSVDKIDLVRRCNSHEEMKENMEVSDVKVESFMSQGISKKDADNLDCFTSDSVDMVINEKNHSPHPPNAKRREIESDKLDYNFLTHSWIDSHKYDSSDNLDTTDSSSVSEHDNCNFDSKQNSIVEIEATNLMECDASENIESGKDDNSLIKNCDDVSNNQRSNIPRSSSCPVPKSEKDSEEESSSLSLSWSMLFESPDSEPLRSEHRYSWPLTKEVQEDTALLSPTVQSLRKSNSFNEAPLSPSAYRSYLSHRSSHLDPSVPPSPPVEQEDFAKNLIESNAVSDSIKQLTKKIHCIKKRIRKFDEKFEMEFGYKPSHAEKANTPEAKKLMNDLHKARKELKALKEESHFEQVSPASWHSSKSLHILGDSTNNVNKMKPSVEETYGVTVKSLADERKIAKRPDCVDDMTNDQVKDEKLAIQRALLDFESIHGKPCSKEERNTIRPLYDRYRSVKRLLVRSGTFPGALSKSKDLCSELQPILEHETMDFTSPQHRTEISIQIEEPPVPEPEVPNETLKTTFSFDDNKNSHILALKYDNSNIHELPLSEMVFQLTQVKSQKRHLRKILREFESEFLRLNGRKVQKEDKAPVDALYVEYKHVKARLKLLEALISKHDQHQLM